MAYMHIDNLYKNQDIFLFRECYAMEKIHGTSAHITWKNDRVQFFAEGCKHEKFVELFDEVFLGRIFRSLDLPEVTVFGEAYGGKLRKMSDTYGIGMRFVAFEVKIGDCWLDVPSAAAIVDELHLDFVPFVLCPATLESLDIERDRPSEQARKNGIEGEHRREGIVIRPLIELTKNNGKRIISKHKAESFRETKTPRVVDAAKLTILKEASAIAEEWVTEMRLSHVLDGRGPVDASDIGDIIKEMSADVEREAAGEIVSSKEVRKAIGRQTALMIKARFQAELAARSPLEGE